jgi:hypothetical protein
MSKLRDVLKLIAEEVRTLSDEKEFREWLRSVRAVEGDSVLVNNSFLFREQLKTRKSELCPVLEIGRGAAVNDLPLIVTGVESNADFKLIRKNDRTQLRVLPLPEEVERQIQELGSVPQVLIGTVEDDVVIETELYHVDFDKVVLEPSLETDIAVRDRVISVRDTHDAETLWADLEELLARAEVNLATLKTAFNQAIDRLEELTYARLVLPGGRTGTDPTVLSAVSQVLGEQRDDYAGALDECKGDPEEDPEAFNEVLRISYNFASDVSGLIRLITSISDLKPLILWTTLAEQYGVASSFKNLPWLRSRAKPSLENYQGTVGDARNSSFHHLFPFRKTLELELPSQAFLEVKLRIFSEYRRKKENQLRYRDKELIDLLTELTRAGQRRVPPHFWRQNLAVMNSTLKLFNRLERALSILYA